MLQRTPHRTPRRARPGRTLWTQGRVFTLCVLLSLLLAACLIIVLFAATLMQWDAGAVIIGLFAGCLAALVGSLILLIWDVNQSLAALRLELEDALEPNV